MVKKVPVKKMTKKQETSQNLADLEPSPAPLFGNLDADTVPKSLQIRVRKPTPKSLNIPVKGHLRLASVVGTLLKLRLGRLHSLVV